MTVPKQWRRESREAYHARLHAWEAARMEEARQRARGETWVTSADPEEVLMREAMARDGFVSDRTNGPPVG